MNAWRGRRPSWRTRYAIVASVTVALALGCWAMFAARAVFEPAVRVLHAALRVRWPGLGHYEPTDYYLYAASPGALSVVGLLSTIWAMATRRRTDAQVDAYLASRLPQHEVVLAQGAASAEEAAKPKVG